MTTVKDLHEKHDLPEELRLWDYVICDMIRVATAFQFRAHQLPYWDFNHDLDDLKEARTNYPDEYARARDWAKAKGLL